MKIDAKLTIVILLYATVLPLIIYNGSIGDFSPKHISIIYETIQYCHLSEIAISNTPGFYIFGSEISLVTGISTKDLLFLPVQLIPFVIIFFYFIYRLSGNYILSGIITFIEMMSDLTGSLRIYFWPHGLGYILFYIVILTLLGLIKDIRMRRFEYYLIIILAGISLKFISYDLFAWLLIYLFISWIIFNILWLMRKNYLYLLFSKRALHLFAIFSVVEFGLSNFFYQTVIFTYKAAANSVEISGMDKFLVAYISSSIVRDPIVDMYLVYPKIISILSAIKYSVLLISIVIFSLMMINKLIRNNHIELYDVIIISLIGAIASFAITRSYIGGIPVTALYLPGIMSTIWLYRFSPYFKKWTMLVILIILIIVPLYYGINYRYGMVNKDENKYDVIKFPSYWYYVNRDNTSQSRISSDELTKDLFQLYISERLTNNLTYGHISETMTLMTTENVMFLTQKRNNSDISAYSNYFAINYNLNSLSLDNWKIIKSWRFFKYVIEYNSKIDKIYDINSVAIYRLNKLNN